MGELCVQLHCLVIRNLTQMLLLVPLKRKVCHPPCCPARGSQRRALCALRCRLAIIAAGSDTSDTVCLAGCVWNQAADALRAAVHCLHVTPPPRGAIDTCTGRGGAGRSRGAFPPRPACIDGATGAAVLGWRDWMTTVVRGRLCPAACGGGGMDGNVRRAVCD